MNKLSPVKDSKDLWSFWRNKCGEDNKDTAIIVGASRIHCGLNCEIIKANSCIDKTIVLSIDGLNCYPIVDDIINNSDYNGIVIYSVFANMLMSQERLQMAEKYVKHYQRYRSEYVFSRLLKDFNTFCNAWTQKHFYLNSHTFYEPGSFIDAFNYEYADMNFQRERKLEMNERLSDDRKEHIRNELNREESTHYLIPGDATELFAERIHNLDKWAATLRARGGRLVLVRMPSYGRLKEYEQQKYPYEQFWKPLSQQMSVDMIHYLDIPGASDFICPDDSHLNYDDAEKFTVLLTNEFIKRGILKARN